MAVPSDLLIRDNDDGPVMADKFNRGLGYVDTAGATVAGDAAAAANSAAQAVAAAGSAQQIALGVSTGLPDIRPSLLLDFTQPGLDPRVIATRASARTYWDRLGVLREAPPNVWPQEFDPATGEGRGRSVWGSATNKMTCRKHNPVDAAGFTPPTSGAVLTVVDDTDELIAAGLGEICDSGKVYKYDNTNGVSASSVTSLAVAGVAEMHTASAFLRGSGSFAISLWGGPQKYAPAPGKYTRVATAGVASSDGARWYINAAQGAVLYFILPQFERGAIATPVIPGDTLSAATRAADVNRFPLSGRILDKCTIVIDYIEPAQQSFATVFQVDDGANSNRTNLRRSGTGSLVFAIIDNNNTIGVLELTSQAAPFGQLSRAALTIDGTFMAASINGAAPLTTTAPAPLNLDALFLSLGVHALGSEQMNCNILRLSFYEHRAVTNAQLQAMSSI